MHGPLTHVVCFENRQRRAVRDGYISQGQTERVVAETGRPALLVKSGSATDAWRQVVGNGREVDELMCERDEAVDVSEIGDEPERRADGATGG
jgi:hypothetical protein